MIDRPTRVRAAVAAGALAALAALGAGAGLTLAGGTASASPDPVNEVFHDCNTGGIVEPDYLDDGPITDVIHHQVEVPTYRIGWPVDLVGGSVHRVNCYLADAGL